LGQADELPSELPPGWVEQTTGKFLPVSSALNSFILKLKDVMLSRPTEDGELCFLELATGQSFWEPPRLSPEGKWQYPKHEQQ
jgi:hypothetical protein